MKKKHDRDKAGITTGTTMIQPMGHKSGNPPEFGSTAKSQKPKCGGHQKVSRGQKIKC